MQKAPCYFGSSHSPILQIRKPQSLFLWFSPLLLILAVLLLVVYYFMSESTGIQVLIFASMAGAKVADIEAVARAVLPKFYCSDLHPESWRVFSACERRCVLTANPSVMVEAFLKEYVGADVVIGTELVVWRGRATGLVCSPGVLVGEKKADALRQAFGDATPEKIEEGAGLVRKEREEKQQRANQAGRQANQRGSVGTA